jgi:hypothetical protein
LPLVFIARLLRQQRKQAGGLPSVATHLDPGWSRTMTAHRDLIWTGATTSITENVTST